jgi:2-polyprenyl-6-methoxyphenol hydroxylase-like FAD-dependent oxidoreductase
VVRSGAPPVRTATFHYGSTAVPVALRPQAGVDALYAPRRTVVDELLVRAAEEAGARFHFRTAVTDVTRDRTGGVTGAVLRDHTGATRVERATVVVGADGRHSMVANRAGSDLRVHGSCAAAYLYGYWPANGFDGYHWYYGHHRSAGVIPTNGGVACVFVAASPAVLADALRMSPPVGAIRRLAAGLDNRLADLVAAQSDGAVRYFRGMPAALRRAYGPGWALVGDAGWWKDPLSTQGITDALRDAELLVRALTSGWGSEAALGWALAEYESERDRTALAMHPIVDRPASHAWDLDDVQRLLRQLSAVMGDSLEATRALDRVVAYSA